MDKSSFLDVGDIVPQVDPIKIHAHFPPGPLARIVYFEWNVSSRKWTAINGDDEPPPYLPPGKFDGQIIQIRLNNLPPQNAP